MPFLIYCKQVSIGKKYYPNCHLLQSLAGLTSQQAAGQQQKVSIGGQGPLGSTWSDPSVNISLDFLSAGLNSAKSPPTLNNIIQQQGTILLLSNVSLFPL